MLVGRRIARAGGALAAWAMVAMAGFAPAAAAPPSVAVTTVSMRPPTAGETFAIRIDDGDPRRSEDKLTPQLWIEEAFAGTTADGRPTCEARALRLGKSGILDPATRDFNMMHVAALTGGGIHVLDPRGGLRGARSLAYVDLGGRPGRMAWSQTTGLLWVTLPDSGAVAAVDAGNWTLVQRYSVGGRVRDIVEVAAGQQAVLVADGERTRIVFVGTPRAAVALPIAAERLALARDGRIVAHGTGAVAVVAGRSVKQIAAALHGSHYIAATDAVFGTDAQGRAGFVTLDGRAGPVADGADVPATRLWAGPDGRVIVAYDPDGSAIAVIDTAARRVVRTIAADRPRSIAGSDNSLFVRTAGRGETMVLPYSGLLEGLPVAPRYIAGGDVPSPARPNLPIIATAEGTSAWIDTERGQVYVYHEGMNIPSATLRLPDATTTDLALIGPLVRPANRTGYAASTRLDRPGEYVAIAKGVEPRYAVCQAFTVAGEGGATRPDPSWRVRLTKPAAPLALGASASFELAIETEGERKGTAPPAYAEAIGLLVMEGSGLGQQRLRATHAGDGRYTAQFVPTRPGAFLLLVDRATLPDRAAGRLVMTFEVAP